MGTRAFSHESIFIPDGQEEDEQTAQTMSQDNILGKVKTLQQQLVKNIKFGQPPTTHPARRMQDTEEDKAEGESPSDPMEVLSQLDAALSDHEYKSSNSPDALSPLSSSGAGTEEETKGTPVKPARSKRPITGSSTIQSINLDAVPRAVARLDNSAAKHKLSVKPKNQRQSKKHKLSKHQQNITVDLGELQSTVKHQYKEQFLSNKWQNTPDRHTIHVDIHAQSILAEGKRLQADHHRDLEKDKERLNEDKRQFEEEKLLVTPEKRLSKLEAQLKKEEERRRQWELKRQELETQRKQEEQKRHELAEQECLGSAALQHLIDEQKGQGEQTQKELDEYKQKAEQRHCELEEQKCRELEEQQRVEKKRQEEEKQKELEEIKQQEVKQERELAKQKHHKVEEQQQLEERRREEEEKQKELEEYNTMEELRKREVEQQHREHAEKQHMEEARKRLEKQKQEELEERRRLEEQREREVEVQKRRELAEKQHLEEERQRLEEKRQKEREERRILEEKKRRELEEQKRREQAEKQRLEEERKSLELQKQKELEEHRRLEEQRKRELEEQKRRELAEKQRLEEERKKLEEQKQRELEERRRLEEQRELELEEQKSRELAEKQRLEEERKRLEEQKQKEQEERRRLEEERRRKLEEQKRRELTEKQRLEEEGKRLEEQKQKEREELRRLEEQRQRELEEQERRELAEKQHLEEERKREEEHKQRTLEERRRLEQQRQQELEQKKRELAEQQRLEKERRKQEEQIQKEVEENRKQEEQRHNMLEDQRHIEQRELEKRRQEDQRKQQIDERNQQELKEQKQPLSDEKQASKQVPQSQRKQVSMQEQERIGEELKWQELDQRQTMPRPYTFQVSSGEKQIIFQKVNLSPVTPSKELAHSSDGKEPKGQEQSKGSHALPSSMNVPHTAILVTGAQLCGTAVNLNQIKDTACKSLLGLTEDRKTMDYLPQENKMKVREHDAKPAKTKFSSDALDNQAMLAEWASIRSRILKGAENGKINEQDLKSNSRCSDDWTNKGKSDFHGNLRKTLSASAKFSITPAWQKFADTAKSESDEEPISPVKQSEDKKVEITAPNSDHSIKVEDNSMSFTHMQTMQETDTSVIEKPSGKVDNAEGCKFAKDLPSFLVPSPPQSPSKRLPQTDVPEASDSQVANCTNKSEKSGESGEEKTSPFGIKLRRTNYSLRFHYDQQGEQKKKKRYSAGDSFDGVPTPLLKSDSEKETQKASVKQFTSPHREYKDASSNVSNDCSSEGSCDAALPILPPINSHISSSSGNEKQVPKSLTPQKPSLSPKPASSTPPPSPHARTNRLHISESLVHSVTKTEGHQEDINVGTVLPPLLTCKNEEEESKEKKSFFPSINIPWREKADKKPELGRKDKPVLQSRHSIDGSRLPEKVETAQPLWITLALQKQKGFREQQATREERKQAREAKQAEKLAKENVGVSNQGDSRCSNSSRGSPLQKSAVSDEEKKLETPVSKVERREQFKKSNTLPTSVTVEISDPAPSAPLAKDVSKRFSIPDSTPLSTEPAWLALAKRKAKAWSDCPQIIK